MPDKPLAAATAVAAYQDVTLTQLQAAFDQIDGDLGVVGAREAAVGRGIDRLESQLAGTRARLEAMGIRVPRAESALPASTPARSLAVPRAPRQYAVPAVPVTNDFAVLERFAHQQLDELGIDPTRDPLLQVLPAGQVTASLQRYADEFGDVSWSEADWAVVLAAGIVATVLDIVLVRIPQTTEFLGKEYAGSPLTSWLKDKERAKRIHSTYFKRYERTAKVPFDVSTTRGTGDRVSGVRPATHRLQSFGHDPLLGLLMGTADIMHGSGTYINKLGKVVQVPTDMQPEQLIVALLKEVRHLLSDMYTPAGIPPPLFTLLQVGQVDSPFALRPNGEKVPWTDIARFMYAHGYDLRHFFTTGIVPAAVQAIVRGYWLLDGMARGKDKEQQKREKAKLTSMLMLANTIATSGTLFKTGVVYSMNPLALNYGQILAMAPVTVAWIKESAARDRRISGALDAEWDRLAAASVATARPGAASV